MEVSANYPFKFHGDIWLNKADECDIGNFNSTSWRFLFNYVWANKYRLIITRSNTSRSFAITCNFSILYKNGHLQKECYLKYIVDGKENVYFPFNLLPNKRSADTQEFLGSITILQLPDSSSKETQVSANSLTECPPALLENSISSPKLSDDFLRLLNNPDSFPDTTLKCGAEDFLVHKAILSVRSPVFAKMFKTEMQESNSGIAEIVDIEPNVLQATLKYLYSGRTDHFDDGIAGEVLFAANKYQLDELKNVCIDKLKSSMTVDNVFRILALGDLHDECLKNQAKEFVCKCGDFSNLEKTEGWKLLQSENPGLAMEVLLFALKYAQKCPT